MIIHIICLANENTNNERRDMSTAATQISAVFLQGLQYENELNIILSPPSELRGDVRSLAGNLGFSLDEILYISEKKYPFVYMLASWIKRVGAEDATLQRLHTDLIELERPDAAQIIQDAIDDLQKQGCEQLNIIASRHNQKLKRSESNASLCPLFSSNSPIFDYPQENSSDTKDTKLSSKKNPKAPVDKGVSDAPSVYVIYVTEITEQLKLIKKLVNNLRKKRVDATADMFESIESSQNQGYHIYRNLIDAEYVLLICTSSFEKKNEESSEGKKATFILKLMLDFIYEHGPYNSKFIPILLPDSNREHIPFILRGCTAYNMSREDFFADLLRRIFKEEKYKLVELPKERPQLKPTDVGNMNLTSIRLKTNK